MKVLMIGAGNVATVLGRMITKSGHEIVQVLSRNLANARELAAELGCSATANFKDIRRDADLYIAAMSDAALNTIKENLSLGDRIIVHTAGSVSIDILKGVSSNYGVMYPLQSLSKDNLSTNLVIPLLIDGSNEKTKVFIQEFANTISPYTSLVNDDTRLKIHVAAVVTNNFINHLYNLAADFCEKEKIDFNILQPLIEETAMRLKRHSPAEMQTGPAIRKDIITLDKHLRILNEYPKLKNVYLKMTESIMNS